MKLNVCIAALMAFSTPALAQDFSLAPNFGQTTLTAGFSPDPYTVDIIAGGDVDASQSPGASGCVGMISNAPDFRLTYEAGGLPLHIFAAAASDVGLVVNTPDGSWACDDDSGGNLNPALTFSSPASGNYDIWVSAVGENSSGAATTLSISELIPSDDGNGPGDFSSNDGNGNNFSSDANNSGSGFDMSLEPTYATLNLAAGFEPDPQIVEVVSGGDNDASSLGAGCVGWGATAPDIRVNYEAGSLPLTFLAMSETGDTALAINLPDGSWVCDDDSAGDLDPVVKIDNPQSGQYDIYITSVDTPSSRYEAVLAVSELVE